MSQSQSKMLIAANPGLAAFCKLLHLELPFTTANAVPLP
jgi:hypothetical protein